MSRPIPVRRTHTHLVDDGGASSTQTPPNSLTRTTGWASQWPSAATVSEQLEAKLHVVVAVHSSSSVSSSPPKKVK